MVTSSTDKWEKREVGGDEGPEFVRRGAGRRKAEWNGGYQGEKCSTQWNLNK